MAASPRGCHQARRFRSARRLVLLFVPNGCPCLMHRADQRSVPRAMKEPAMADVTLRRISKRFGTTEAVSDLSLAIEDGEFVVLLGPSGAGKTTTLRLVAGLERPDAGAILIDGRDV